MSFFATEEDSFSSSWNRLNLLKMIGRKGVISKTPETEHMPPVTLPPEKQQQENHTG